MKKEEVLSKLKEECIFKESEFVEKIIAFKESITIYYRRYHGKNIVFHPIKYLKYKIIKRYLEKHNYEIYINKYLNENEGWYKSMYIPKNNKNEIPIEVITIFGKNIKNAKTCGFGFTNDNDPLCSFGWTFWIRRWRFVDKDSKEELSKII